MTAFYIKTKNMTPFNAVNALNIKLDYEKIMFLKEYYCHVVNKIRDNKKPILKYGLIMLIGTSCSGKTTFSNKLLTLYGSGTVIHLNQDEIGKKACEKLLLDNAKKPNKTIILDRCNLSKEERKEWLILYKQLTNRKILGIYFNYDLQTCKNRLMERDNHTMKNIKILENIFNKKVC